jgi:hypothetical protein
VYFIMTSGPQVTNLVAEGIAIGKRSRSDVTTPIFPFQFAEERSTVD